MRDISALFAAGGALSGAVSGYQPRQGQQELAEAVADNLSRDGILLAEAGTGTGKTFAYLLPLLASGRKGLVSTATRNLQEQIYGKDLPLVRKVLGSVSRVALLKGRRNYLCHHHYHQYLDDDCTTAADKRQRRAIEHFFDTTADGDLVGLKEVAEDAPVLARITSTIENCLGRDCAFYEECYLQKARQKAKEADVVVINHHLLLADFALKSEGFAEILPDIQAFVIDEAHHLPQTAIHFLGDRFSARQLLGFINDGEHAALQEAADALELRECLRDLKLQNSKILLTVRQPTETRLDEEQLAALPDFWMELRRLAELLARFQSQLNTQKMRGKLLAHLYGRGQDLQKLIAAFLAQAPVVEDENAAKRDNHALQDEDAVGQDNDAAQDESPGSEPTPRAVWLDVGPRHYTLCSVPVNAAGRFATWIANSNASWAFLSATLAVNGSFAHYARELGLCDYQSLLLASPFDFRHQALLYHPEGLPDPNHPQYNDALIQAVLPVLARSKGRAFLLFTSYRAMHEAERALQDSGYHLLVQGRAGKNALLADFRRHDNAVLLATSSFWEGVDVRGDRLVCVVIDKLPFTAPNDPVARARHRLLTDKGLSPFIHDTLPQAIITLKQGVGRLIRDRGDYGVLVLADPRLTRKNYGTTFLNSLPPMTKTRKIEVIDRFFAYHENNNGKPHEPADQTQHPARP
ncbi:ATP-dependent DNA helicase [Cardiobacterium sp. Marseille-Q4385]|uniref:ATP-dependent DNA helicase n=1 Tax=Cardiobacterium sp. Marseille-Q4385 TaxID=2866573 RepID=UPI001CE3E395|nr:ATP-dependent DNA helicase [Cardiobacterium sp. Marseille-Q4385]